MNRDTQVNFLTSSCRPRPSRLTVKPSSGKRVRHVQSGPTACSSLNWQYPGRRGEHRALLHHLGTLQPGETRRPDHTASQVKNLEAATPPIQRFRSLRQLRQSWRSWLFWDDYLFCPCKFQTPGREHDLILNVYNPRQCYVTKTWSRDLSITSLDWAAEASACAISSQDVISVWPPSEGARNFSSHLLSFQKRDGSSMHQ